MEAFNQELVDRKVTRDVVVKPTPAVTGQPMETVHSNLSWLDAKGAFVAGRPAWCRGRGDHRRRVCDRARAVRWRQVRRCRRCRSRSRRGCRQLPRRGDTPSSLRRCASAELRPVGSAAAQEPGAGAARAVAGDPGEMDCRMFGFRRGKRRCSCCCRARSQSCTRSSATTRAAGRQLVISEGGGDDATGELADCDIATQAFPMVRVINIFERADQVATRSRSARPTSAWWRARQQRGRQRIGDASSSRRW